MKLKPGFGLLFGVVAAVLAVAGAVSLLRPGEEEGPLPHSAYVWQRAWGGGVTEAMAESAPHFASFMVLAGEARYAEGGPSVDVVHVDWAAAARGGRPLVLVLRADVSMVKVFCEAGAEDGAAFLEGFLRETAAQAQEAGAEVGGVQLDYDCPTSKLGGYAAVLRHLRERMAEEELSITALPTWLTSETFTEVVRRVDYFVLQVHSLERPSSVDEPVVLCRTDRIGDWVRAAGRTGAPFWVALPTYGYEVVFDGDGRFLGLHAETPDVVWEQGVQVRTVLADPAEMALAVQALSEGRPKGLAGVVWFRLPVQGDALNWPWPALRAVVEGRVPMPRIGADVRQPDAGLFEIWVRNAGECNLEEDVRIRINTASTAGSIGASDTLNEYEEVARKGGAIDIEGPAPKVGEERMVAWYRLWPGSGADSDSIQAEVIGRIE